MPAYFDTNVIRYLRTGLNAPLAERLRPNILLSPISAIEVLSQIGDAVRGEEALQSIHRFRDWLPAHTILLSWLETFTADRVFGIEIEDEIFPIVEELLERALAANNVSLGLRKGAANLSRITEEAKLRKAALFQRAADQLRSERLAPRELEERVKRDITLGIEQRVGAAAGAKTQAQIEGSLSAYCEFHKRSVLAAVENAAFRFDSREHLNDHFDGEQLLYLAVPEYHFISSDTGFNGVLQTAQGPRVHIVPAITLENPITAAVTLEGVLDACTPAPGV